MIAKPIKIFFSIGLVVILLAISINIYQTFTNPYVDYTCRVYYVNGKSGIKHLVRRYHPRQPQMFRLQRGWINEFNDSSIYKFDIIKTDTLKNYDNKRRGIS